MFKQRLAGDLDEPDFRARDFARGEAAILGALNGAKNSAEVGVARLRRLAQVCRDIQVADLFVSLLLKDVILRIQP